MINTLILAAAIASQCMRPMPPSHHVHHATRLTTTVQSCAPVSSSAALPAILSDEDIEPIALGLLTKYLIVTDTEPCHVYTSANNSFFSGWDWPAAPNLRGIQGSFRAPELDPRGGLEAVLALSIALIILDARKIK